MWIEMKAMDLYAFPSTPPPSFFRSPLPSPLSLITPNRQVKQCTRTTDKYLKHVYLLNDNGVEMQLHFGSLDDTLINSAFGYEAENSYLLLLTDSMRTILQCHFQLSGKNLSHAFICKKSL